MCCVQNGATYHPDLTKNVTHLLAAAPTGKKYEFAIQNGVTIVHPQWLEDSLQRGMALEESYYGPHLPPDKLGVGAKPAPLTQESEIAVQRGPRKIRKAVEDKLGSQSQNIWDDIMGNTASNKAEKRDEWEDRPAKMDDLLPVVMEEVTPKPVQKRTGMLDLCAVYIFGFEGRQKVTLDALLNDHAAEVHDSFDGLVGSEAQYLFMLVPRDMKRSEYPAIPDDKIEVVTEWWLEDCIHMKSLQLPSDEDISTMPFEEYPIPG